MPASHNSMSDMLAERRYATLATHNLDGSMHLTPVWYLFEDGRFYVESLSSDRKSCNLAARPSATIMVDVRDPGRDRWVYASGPVDILEGDASREINARILQRYLTDEGIDDARIGPAFASAVDSTFCLTPEVWRSWSLQDLDEQFFGGILALTPERWFRPLAS